MSTNFICPYCRREIHYQYCENELDRQYQENSQRVTEIMKRFHEMKNVTKTRSIKTERLSLQVELALIQQQQDELREASKSLKKYKYETEFSIFKNVVRRMLGEKEYNSLIEEVVKLIGEYSENGGELSVFLNNVNQKQGKYRTNVIEMDGEK